MDGIKLNTGASTEIVPYKIGSTVDLIFQTDDITAQELGRVIRVQILDIFDNLIATLTANQADDGQPLYITEYKIPFNLSSLYNISNLDIGDLNIELFYLKDKWIFTDTSYLEFPFTVQKAPDQVITDNAEFFVELTDIKGVDDKVIGSANLHFTTHLTPFYCGVQEVVDTYSAELSAIDSFEIARDIIGNSKLVDFHIKPNIEYITYQDKLDNAIKDYVAYLTAFKILQMKLSVASEEKALDTFRISRNTTTSRLLDMLEDWMKYYEKIIWAGGKDTPFITKTFEKGLYDPNRPNIGRSSLDLTGWYPYVNNTTSSTLMNIDGNEVEVRGTRSITFTSGIMSKYFAFDKGDVGYLAGI